MCIRDSLVSRTVAMIEKYFGGVLPAPGEEQEPDAKLREHCEACLLYTSRCV